MSQRWNTSQEGPSRKDQRKEKAEKIAYTPRKTRQEGPKEGLVRKDDPSGSFPSGGIRTEGRGRYCFVMGG